MRKSILLLSVITFVSCQKKENTTIKNETSVKSHAQLDKARWLIGEWGNSSKEGDLTEIWSQLNDSTLAGKTSFVAGKDTIFMESIEIVQKNDSLFYNTQVSNQNDGKSISFKNTDATENQVVFENPKHDFPQKIVYNKITADSLVVEVSGMKKGKESKESFPMKKKK